jgi:hypothetical protein
VNCIAANRQRLAAATDLARILDAAYDAFEDIIAVARSHQEDEQTAFPAFVLAACSAADGRDWIAEAPSLPPTSHGDHDGDLLDDAPITEVASALAAIAGELTTRLTAAAQAANRADRACCDRAAAEASTIRALMGGASPP